MARTRGKFKQAAAHGEGYVKGFLDTGSIPVISTKKKRTPHGVLFFLVEYANPLKRKAFDSGSHLPEDASSLLVSIEVANPAAGGFPSSLPWGFLCGEIPMLRIALRVRLRAAVSF